jgi:hypothetical protein
MHCGRLEGLLYIISPDSTKLTSPPKMKSQISRQNNKKKMKNNLLQQRPIFNNFNCDGGEITCTHLSESSWIYTSVCMPRTNQNYTQSGFTYSIPYLNNSLLLSLHFYLVQFSCVDINPRAWLIGPFGEKERDATRQDLVLYPSKRTSITGYLGTSSGWCWWSICIELLIKQDKK